MISTTDYQEEEEQARQQRNATLQTNLIAPVEGRKLSQRGLHRSIMFHRAINLFIFPLKKWLCGISISWRLFLLRFSITAVVSKGCKPRVGIALGSGKFQPLRALCFSLFLLWACMLYRKAVAGGGAARDRQETEDAAEASEAAAGVKQGGSTCAASSTCPGDSTIANGFPFNGPQQLLTHHGGKRRLQRRQRRVATAARSSTAATRLIKQCQTNLDRPQTPPPVSL